MIPTDRDRRRPLTDAQREQAARWFAAQRDRDAECLADDLIAIWRRSGDDLAARATLDPYAGTVILAILWGDVVPVGWVAS